jgi:hypothetical protein
VQQAAEDLSAWLLLRDPKVRPGPDRPGSFYFWDEKVLLVARRASGSDDGFFSMRTGRDRAISHTGTSMRKIGWNLVLSLAFALASPMALAASRVDHPIRQNLLQPDSENAFVLAQASLPAASPAAPPADSKPSQEPSTAVASPPPDATATEEVAKAPSSAPGCAVKFMAAELAGKLKGQKWKEFREEECGASTTHAVFPTTIAPKYSGQTPDKARTLTCADQFSANKTTNANGGLKWIEKGGGYYSECVNRLKG